MAAPTNTWIKYIALALLVLQNAFLILFMAMSRSSNDSSLKLYATSTAVVTAECVKLICCFGVLYYEALMSTMNPVDSGSTGVVKENFIWQECCPKSVTLFLEHLDKELLQKPQEFVKCSVPSLCYTVQNNLLYYALSNLDAVTFQVGYQCKILTTALFSVFMLKKQLSNMQWGSLVILMAGVTMAQVSSSSGNANPNRNSTMGFLAVFAAAVSSGFSGVYLETILKNTQSSLWIRNIQLSTFGIVIGLITVYMQPADYQSVMENGFFYGYTNMVWSVIMLQAVGGLLVAVVVKYADNILKGFAASFSMITSCVLSIFLVDFKPTLMFVIGAVLVNVAMYIYGKYPYVQTDAEVAEAQINARNTPSTPTAATGEKKSLLGA